MFCTGFISTAFRTTSAVIGRLPPGSALLALLLLLGLLGGGDLLGAVQERAQRHPAEHVTVRLLDELHQLADVAVQTLWMRRRRGKRREVNRWRMSDDEEEEENYKDAEEDNERRRTKRRRTKRRMKSRRSGRSQDK